MFCEFCVYELDALGTFSSKRRHSGAKRKTGLYGGGAG